MSKSKLNVETIKFSITTTKKVGYYLDMLINTELYGKTRAQVAEQIIRTTIVDFVTSDKFEKLNKKL